MGEIKRAETRSDLLSDVFPPRLRNFGGMLLTSTLLTSSAMLSGCDNSDAMVSNPSMKQEGGPDAQTLEPEDSITAFRTSPAFRALVMTFDAPSSISVEAQQHLIGLRTELEALPCYANAPPPVQRRFQSESDMLRDILIDFSLTRDFDSLTAEETTVLLSVIQRATDETEAIEQTTSKIVAILSSSPSNIGRDKMLLELLSHWSQTGALLYVARDYSSDDVAEIAIEYISRNDPAIAKWLQAVRETAQTIRDPKSSSDNSTSFERIRSQIALLTEQYRTQQTEIADLRSQLKAKEDRVAQLAQVLENNKRDIEAKDREIDRLRNPNRLTRRESGYEVEKIASYGGNRGQRFDWMLPEGARIVGIGGRGGERLDCFWAIYEENGIVKRTPHWGGGGGSQPSEVLFDNDEYLTWISLNGNKTADHVVFATNKKRTFWFGDGGSRVFPLDKTSDGAERIRKTDGVAVVIGFHGNSDNETRAIGLYVQYKPTPQTSVAQVRNSIAALETGSRNFVKEGNKLMAEISEIRGLLGGQ